jgi:predicted TIM-barrel fold metal-dependent hydrolase
LKLHPLGYRMVPDHQLTVNLVNLAAKFDAPVLLHCGDEEYTYPLQIEKLARACPTAKIILGHMGGYFHVKEAIRVAERCPNVYLETSATPYPQLIKEAVRRVGPKRVLFASDGPGCDPRLEVYKVELAGLKKSEEKLIFSDNILEILDKVRN